MKNDLLKSLELFFETVESNSDIFMGSNSNFYPKFTNISATVNDLLTHLDSEGYKIVEKIKDKK